MYQFTYSYFCLHQIMSKDGNIPIEYCLILIHKNKLKFQIIPPPLRYPISNTNNKSEVFQNK